MDRNWTKISFIEYHVLTLHEMHKMSRSTKCATEYIESNPFVKSTPNLYSTIENPLWCYFITLYINYLCKEFQISMIQPSYFLDKMMTNITKREDVNALSHPLGTLSLYDESRNPIGTKIVIISELQVFTGQPSCH